jgi:hypothetical protein
MSRGRPTESEAVIRTKYVQTCYEYPSKPELGWKSVWHFDVNKSPNGAYKVEHTPSKDFKEEKFKPPKGKAYNKQPVVMVFKTSKNSNAKTKMKIWKNENIDYIITQDKLVGVPDKAVILELGVGDKMIETYKSKYNL